MDGGGETEVGGRGLWETRCGSHLMKPSWFWRVATALVRGMEDGRGVVNLMVAVVLKMALEASVAVRERRFEVGLAMCGLRARRLTCHGARERRQWSVEYLVQLEIPGEDMSKYRSGSCS